MTPTGTAHSARRAGTVLLTAAMAFTGMALTAAAGAGTAQRGGAAAATAATATAPPYSCAPNGPAGSQTIYGTFGDASVIGWAGNSEGVTACLGGSFFVTTANGPGSGSTAAVTGTTYGYGVYDDSPTTWANADGYLPGPGHHVPPGRRPHLDHQLRRQGHDRRPRLRGDLQPGPGGQPHRPGDQHRPRAVGRPDPARLGAGHGSGPRHREPRLRGGLGPVRRHLRLAVGRRDQGRGRLRPALRAHARLLERPAGRDHPDPAAARPEPGRRVPDRLHLHPDHPVRRQAQDRGQRLRHGVQPRRHRHPGQPVHPGLHDRRARRCWTGPAT